MFNVKFVEVLRNCFNSLRVKYSFSIELHQRSEVTERILVCIKLMSK